MGVRAGTWLLALTATLSACSTEEPPSVLPQLSPPSTFSAPARIPKAAIPSGAQVANQAGASAFVRYYFEEVNKAYEDLDAARIRELSANSCNSCLNLARDVERLRAANMIVDGSRFVLQSAEASPLEGDGRILVDFRYSSDPYVEVDASGRRRTAEPAVVNQDAQAVLRRVGPEWSLLGLRLLGGQ